MGEVWWPPAPSTPLPVLWRVCVLIFLVILVLINFDHVAERYPESSETFKMEHFTKIVNSWTVNYFHGKSIIDVWLGILVLIFIAFLLCTYYQARSLTCLKWYVVALWRRFQICLTIPCLKLFFNAVFHFYTPRKCRETFGFINIFIRVQTWNIGLILVM